jgi:hypothetical protein
MTLSFLVRYESAIQTGSPANIPAAGALRSGPMKEVGLLMF